jgi:NAD-dependent deacetylase
LYQRIAARRADIVLAAMSANWPPALLVALRNARHVVVLTGAGISAESGIPTFRDAMTGLWARFRPEDLATADAFRRDPALVWDWYEWRRGLVAAARPNAGHRAVTALQARVPACTVITQNVDGLHQDAGTRGVIELHGNLRRSKCFAEDRVVPEWPATDARPPLCPRCGAPLRPDVVWFGESLPPDALAAAGDAARDCDVLISIGTSAVVYPAAALPATALAAGAKVVEVNRDATPLSGSATWSFRGAAGESLPALVAAAWPGAVHGGGDP